MFKLIAIETLQRHENLYRITKEMSDYQRRAVDLLKGLQHAYKEIQDDKGLNIAIIDRVLFDRLTQQDRLRIACKAV